MAAFCVPSDLWKADDYLKNEITRYVTQGLKRTEMLGFLRSDFQQYAWSIRTLDRRLRHFQIFYTDKTVSVEDIRTAVGKELKAPVNLLGYRAMQKRCVKRMAYLCLETWYML